ncbi:hypothetical protein Vafri_8816 [Volvox africanus]|uniref:SCP domain-containing protein n=1 Tax=Volvox africanus TaxID=51714 RepID=A0A8J4EZ42_9CHLO|nr:hypothetical protein Vafri_8816 [Volvox africanus]
MLTSTRSVAGMALLLFHILVLGSTAQGYLPRRVLQQTWSSASSTALATSRSSSSASAYSSTSSGPAGSSAALAQPSDDSQWSNYLGTDQRQQISQQQQEQIKSLFGSLTDAFQGYFSGGDDGQQSQPSTQSEQLQQPQPAEQQQQPSSQPQQVQQAPAAAQITNSTSPTSSTASNGFSAYAQQCLDTHNYYRAKHQSTSALRWSSSLEADAQVWANRCVFSHADNTASGQGENIAWGYPDAKSVIDAYYSEGAGYTYGVSQPADWHSVGHFTQVIWRSSTDLGCAVATCSGGQLFHVCRYYPPGNVQGQYSGNVMPPSS